MDENELFRIWFKERTRAQKKLMYEFHYKTLSKDPMPMLDLIPTSQQVEFVEYLDERGSRKYMYGMYTINPVEHTAPSIFLKKIQKSVKKIWIKNYIWCIEWRDDKGGMHAHIRVEYADGKNPYLGRREFYNTFKHMVGSIKHINVRYGNRKDCFIDYVKGLKDGKPKPNSDNDKKHRQLYNLKDYYESDACQSEAVLNVSPQYIRVETPGEEN